MNAWWVAPVYPQADIAYRRIKNSLTMGSFTAFASPFPRIELISGGIIWIKSADNPDSLFGEDVYDIVLDEASRAKPETWPAIVSVLTATKGNCRLIGNVKGRKNFFYNLARLAEKHELPNWHYAKITYQDAVAAGVLDQEIIDDARRTISERDFQELYEATAADDTGNPFGSDHIQACIQNLSNDPIVAWGVDLAKKQDYLVVIGLTANGRVGAFHRWRDLPWRSSIRKIHAIVGEDIPALIDSTGIGDPILEELQVDHNNFSGYMFSLASKQKLMEGLAVSIQGHEIGYPLGPIVSELDSFEYNTTPAGRTIYAAAQGHNDDCVCALALARQVWTETQPGQNLTNWMSNEVERGKTETQKIQSDPYPSLNQINPKFGPSRIEIIDNELTEIYQNLLQSLSNPNAVLCFHCGKSISDPSRISDGELVWHTSCMPAPGQVPNQGNYIDNSHQSEER